jgi:hypothetical protein
MKSVTEFWSFALIPAIKTKSELTAAGKTPEEVQTAIGETYKMEGDKLKHFVAALGVAEANLDKLSRILVVSVAEGEAAPAKAVKVEEFYYMPEFQTPPRPVQNKKTMEAAKGGGRGGGKGGKGGDRPKTSPWGLTPEEKAAKKGGGKNAPKPS